jgi:hypothetical protein
MTSSLHTSSPMLWHHCQKFLQLIIQPMQYCILDLFVCVRVDFYKRMSDAFKGSKIVTWLVRWDWCCIGHLQAYALGQSVIHIALAQLLVSESPYDICSMFCSLLWIPCVWYLWLWWYSCTHALDPHACTSAHAHTKTPWSLWLIVLPVWF